RPMIHYDFVLLCELVRQLAVPPFARRHAVLLAKHPSEMRQVVKAPGKRNFANLSMCESRGREIALATGQPLGEHIALERSLLIRQQVVEITRRDAECCGGRRQRKLGVGKMGADMGLETAKQRGAMG